MLTFALLIAPCLGAQTTGSVFGTVYSGDGLTPLPHAQVMIRGPLITRTVTTSDGSYRFALPPGRYSVSFTYPQLSGCGSSVIVSLGHDTEVNGRLVAAIVCCITVTHPVRSIDSVAAVTLTSSESQALLLR